MTTFADTAARSLLFRHCDAAPLLDPELERELLRKAQDGDKRATERLVFTHMRMVRKLARSYARGGVCADDLFSEGMLGLLEAIRRFDLERSNRFNTYAGWWVRARLGRYATEARHLVPLPSTRNARRIRRLMDRTVRSLCHELGREPTREELAVALNVSPEEVAVVEAAVGARAVILGTSDDGTQREVPDQGLTPEQLTFELEGARQRKQVIEAAFGTLSARERTVLERRVMDDERDSLATLGDDLGISRERVRQIQVQAERKLRSQLRDVA